MRKKRKGRIERVFVLIDGSNFYHRLKEPEVDIKNQLQFDFKGFIRWLVRKRKIVQVGFMWEECGQDQTTKRPWS